LRLSVLGRPAIDGERVDAEGRLELGVLEEVVDDDLRDGIALEFDDEAAVFSSDSFRIAADVGEDLLVDEFGDALFERGAG
jgi:hypothetical protein